MKHKQFAIIMILLTIALVIEVTCHGQTIRYKAVYPDKGKPYWAIDTTAYKKDNRKPLRNTHYRYKALVRRGYECKPFRGSIFINYKRYLELVNNKTVTK